MNSSVAKQLRKMVGLKDINQARDDVTYMLVPTSYCYIRRIKDEKLKQYKRAKEMYYDPELRGELT